MEHSEFTSEHAWMNGLHEYYKDTMHADDYELLYKSLYHDNAYRRRDLLMRMHDEVNVDALWNKQSTLTSFYNCILHKDLPDYEVKQRSLMGVVNSFMKDDYAPALYRFICSFEDDNLAPDFNDFFSRGQVQSKKWLIEELNTVISGTELGNVAILGAWYNFMAHMLFKSFDIDKMYSVDIDSSVVKHINNMYKYEVSRDILVPITADVTSAKWHDNDITVIIPDVGPTALKDIDMIINTSCEHMSDEWFNNLPDGMLVVLQTNNYFDNVQHSNCVADIDAVKSKYKMTKVLYDGVLSTQLYDRYMLIGIK